METVISAHISKERKTEIEAMFGAIGANKPLPEIEEKVALLISALRIERFKCVNPGEDGSLHLKLGRPGREIEEAGNFAASRTPVMVAMALSMVSGVCDVLLVACLWPGALF